jgi:hypothetical protein
LKGKLQNPKEIHAEHQERTMQGFELMEKEINTYKESPRISLKNG